MRERGGEREHVYYTTLTKTRDARICRLPLNQLDQPNRRAGRSATNKTHLNASPDASEDVVTPRPPAHNARLDIPKRQQCHAHHGNTPVQRGNHLIHHEIRNQRDKPSNKVSQRQGDGRDPSLVAVRSGFLVVHGEEEFEQAVVRCVQGAVDLGRYVGWDAVRCEDGVDDGCGRGGRCLNELSCFADGGFV